MSPLATLIQIKGSIFMIETTIFRGYISEKIYEYPLDPEQLVASIMAIPLP